MIKTNPVFLFLVLLTLFFGLFFSIHFSILKIYGFPPDGNKIVFSYMANFMLAASIFIVLYALRNKLKDQIGFLFMGGSLLKFMVFFIFFYPTYRNDGVMDKLEFAAFFVPYALGLLIETVFTAQILKKRE